jgi:hypothetical protein
MTSCVKLITSAIKGSELVVTANLQRASRLRQSIFPKVFTGDLHK